MDIGRVQPAGTGVTNAVNHVTADPGAQQAAASQRDLIQAVKAVNGTELFGQDSELTFVFDRRTQKALVRIVDKKTREVRLQIPPERVLLMAEEQRKAL